LSLNSCSAGGSGSGAVGASDEQERDTILVTLECLEACKTRNAAMAIP